MQQVGCKHACQKVSVPEQHCLKSWHFHGAGHYYRPFCTLNINRWHVWNSHTTCTQHLWAWMLDFLIWTSFYCQTLTPCLTTEQMNSLAQHASQS